MRHLPLLLLLALLPATAGAADLSLGDATAWEGLKPDTGVTRDGRPSGLWEDPVATPNVRLKQCPKDWSHFRGIDFWLHSAVATGKRITLVAMSDRGTYDYFQCIFPVDWTGWKRFSLPYSLFWKVRNPKGWDQVDAFILSANWDDKPVKETVLRMADAKLTDDVPSPTSEIMSDALLLGRLDLARPGMEAVRAAVAANDLAKTRAELVAYYRGRRRPRYFVDPDARPAPNPKYDTRAAERAAQHTFTYYQYPPQQLGAKIDWETNPVGDYEWPTALNRHGDFAALARAWFHTNDDRYARALEEMLMDWIGQAKAANIPLRNVYWSTLNTACRLGDPWPTVWYALRDCDAFSPEARVAMLKSLWHQAEYLMQNHGGGNWLLTESKALVAAGTLFPEFARAADWKAEGWRRLSNEIREQTYPEGAQFELTPHYHIACIAAFRGPVDLAVLNGEKAPEEYLRRLERMYEYMALVSKPDRCIPMLNDSDHNDIRSLMRDANRLFPRDDFRYLAADGTEGRPPAPTSLAFPFAGQYVMRTGWERDALYCVMDAGPYGFGHQHEDKLSLDIHAYGADLVSDPGRFTYAGGPFGEFFRGSRAHNLILVDGQGQNRRATAREGWVAKEPAPAAWISRDGFDYVRARYDEGFGPKNDANVTHERAVLFLKPDYWVVCDFLTPADDREHTYDWLWHFGPGEAAVVGHQVHFMAQNAGMVVANTLAAAPAVAKGQENPVQGWVSYWYGKKEPAPASTYTVKAAGPLAVITVLAPFRGQEASAVRIAESSCAGGLAAARVLHPGGSDVVLFSGKPGTPIAWGGLSTVEAVAYQRRDAAGAPAGQFAARERSSK